MLAVRVIPIMLCDGHKLVKGKRFLNDRVVGHAAQAARVHAMRAVDELMILDVTATRDGRGPNLSLIEEITDTCFIPVTVGGGIAKVDQIRDLLKCGADKVCIGNAARENPRLITEAASRFGSQAIVVPVDYPRDSTLKAAYYASMGAGEILLNNMERDGTMEGYDLDLIRYVSSSVAVPVIACGGCRDYDDMAAAVMAGASAAAAGALFQFDDATPQEAVRHLAGIGIEVRIP